MTEVMSMGSRQSLCLRKGQDLCLSYVYISPAKVVLDLPHAYRITLDLTYLVARVTVHLISTIVKHNPL
jgi:hypothetical protein